MIGNSPKRILFIGEFSGVHTNLREGLLSNGIQVVIAGDGDVFKSFAMDIDLKAYSRIKYLRLLERILKEIRFILSINNNEYDCVQLMGPYALSEYLPFFYLRLLKRKCGKLLLYSAGEDYYFWRAYRLGYFRYSIHDVLAEQGRLSKFERGFLKYRNKRLVNFVDGIICGSIMYEYGYRDFPNYLGYLPFPISIAEDHGVRHMCTDRPIKVLFPRQKGRELEKGFNIFAEALIRFNCNFPGRIEIVEVQNETYENYLKRLAECHILLDQLYGYDPGMNALVGLVNGLVVFGGQEREYVEAVNGYHKNLINVIPNVDNVYEKFCEVVLNFSKFDLNSWETSIRKTHESNYVAKLYLMLIV